LISSVQQRHTNQYSLPLGLFLFHLKLWPHGRQTAQHISWSQGRSTSPLISKSILWTSTLVWTMFDISKIIVNEAFIVTDGPISWLFVIAFVHSIYVFETFQYNLVCRNWSTTSRDISWIKFVTLLVYAILLLAYSKEPCIIFKVNIYKICYIMSSCSKTFYNILYVM